LTGGTSDEAFAEATGYVAACLGQAATTFTVALIAIAAHGAMTDAQATAVEADLMTLVGL
jgi:hypothetical protein